MRRRAAARAAATRARSGAHARPRLVAAAVVAAALCVAAIGALSRMSAAFVSAPALGGREAVSEAPASGLGRRGALLGAAWGLTAGFGSERAEAIKDARQDSICTIKCLDICLEKVPGNNVYCDDSCNKYCSQSKQEQDMKDKVAGGSSVDKILARARAGKFKNGRQDDKKVAGVDLFIGRAIAPNNETDYANGMKEAIRR
mmetsp:Transcript_59927/g.195716  ORF Transcript_59927/g.195716 Transcript_59927/m.195716 type:complete len:201 (-) Transcript_59927:45-647(-)